jgi:hypothetical protein
MNLNAKLLLLLVTMISVIIMISKVSSPFYSAMAKINNQNMVDLESDQSFSCDVGSIVEYNIYIENRGKSVANYELSALSSTGYYIEIWRDMDRIGSGDVQLLPPQESSITLGAGEVATLVIMVTIPFDATRGTVDNTIITAVKTGSGTSDSVTVTTTVNSNLPYPSTWIQLGSDPTFPVPPPERIDIKASYYTNNGTDVFFRIAEVSKPNTIAFRHSVYLDVREGGQQIDSYNYDYLLSSDGVLYEWNGANWINSGYTAFWQVDGTGLVLWTDLDNLIMDMQEIHFLACTATKNEILKDILGPYTLLSDNISEIPLILIPIVILTISYSFLKRNTRVPRTHKITA